MKKLIAAVAAAVMVLGAATGLSACGGDGGNGHEHVWNDGEITTLPTCAVAGVKTFRCTVEGCTESYTEPVEKIAHDFTGEWVEVDESGHARKCADCETIDEDIITHTYKETLEYNNDGHRQVCEDCGFGTEFVGHEFDGGTVVVEAAFNRKGEVRYVCGCGYEKTEETGFAEANYREEFTVSPDDDCPWAYGTVEYTWRPENFTFTAATETTDEAWKADGNEIKAGWINSDGNVAIGYKIAAGITKIKYDLSYTGGGDDPGRFSVRIWRTAADGTLVGNSVFISQNADGGEVTASGEMETAEGETVYLIFFHESGWSQVDDFNYVLTNVTPQN